MSKSDEIKALREAQFEEQQRRRASPNASPNIAVSVEVSPNRASPNIKTSPNSNRGTSPNKMSRNARWRLKYPDTYRHYMKDYMQRRRAEAKS